MSEYIEGYAFRTATMHNDEFFSDGVRKVLVKDHGVNFMDQQDNLYWGSEVFETYDYAICEARNLIMTSRDKLDYLLECAYAHK